MKKLASKMVVAVALVSGVMFLAVPEAESLKCGESQDGTFDYSSYACGGAARDCTEIVVCAPKK